MKTKNNSKQIITYFQIFAVVFFVIGILGKLLLENGYEILIFESTCLYFSYQICFSIFLLTEFIMLIVLAIKNNKHLLLIANVVLFPLLLLQLFATNFAIFDSQSRVKTYTYEQFEKDVVIENRSFLLSGSSTIYEKRNSFLLKKITCVEGDDGYCPLDDESEFEIVVNNNVIAFYYFFDYDRSPEAIRDVTIIHNDGHYKVKNEK